MSDLILSVHLRDAVQGRMAMKDQVLPFIGAHLQAGRQLVCKVVEAEDALTEQQRGYYHVVLQFIADHATANGQKFPMPVWKEWFRDRFLGFKVRSFTNPMTGRKSRRRVRVSSEDLGVRGYANLIDQVIAFASTELGLTVPEPREPLPKPQRARRRERVDPETGEILTNDHAAEAAATT